MSTIKTLRICGPRKAQVEIRAMAFPGPDGGPKDICHTLRFLTDMKEKEPRALDSLMALLRETNTNGIPKNEEKFKKLTGTELFEFKARTLRLFCFWDDARLICTHGFEKKKWKTPKEMIERGEQFRKRYFEAKTEGKLIHV